jgi:hypothetical protein
MLELMLRQVIAQELIRAMQGSRSERSWLSSLIDRLVYP